jgi:TolB-like protein
MSTPPNLDVVPPNGRLDSWKEIASYMGRSERTVRRWEEREGLPVHRLAHEKRGSIYAYRSELDSWRASKKQLVEADALETDAPKAQPQTLSKLWLVATLVAVAVGLTATGWWWLHKSTDIAVAVLPFRSLSQDSADDYFVDGLTDEVIGNLSVIEGLAVRSQTSSFAFKGKPRNVREAGRQLEADYILEGSVLRSGQQLRINIQLIRARDDFPLWSGRYDREVTDIFTIQDEISRAVVNNFRLKLGRGRRRYETSAEAYDTYLRARAVQTQNGALGSPLMVAFFEEAIAKDRAFAPAYAGLAAAYAFRSGTPAGEEDALPKMRAAADEAIHLDPLLAEAHDALGWVYARDGQWRSAEESFRRAIELDPSRSMSYIDFALNLLLPLGRIEESIRQLRIAEKYDPLSPMVQDFAAGTLISGGRFDEAADHCQKLPADYPFKPECLGRARLGQGRINEAIQILANSDQPVDRGYLGYAYGRAGRRAEAEKIAATVVRDVPYQRALIFAGLNDKERALEAVELMAKLGPVRLGRDLTYPELAMLRGDARVKSIRKRVGLPE